MLIFFNQYSNFLVGFIADSNARPTAPTARLVESREHSSHDGGNHWACAVVVASQGI